MKLTPTTKIVLAAIAYLIIAEIVNVLSSMLTMSYYTDPNYFAVWSKIMMPGAGPPPVTFYYYSITFASITGIIYSYAYSKIRNIFKGNSAVQKGLRYGFGLFLVAGIPFFFTVYLLVNLPIGLLVYWLLINGLIMNLLAGITIAKILD